MRRPRSPRRTARSATRRPQPSRPGRRRRPAGRSARSAPGVWTRRDIDGPYHRAAAVPGPRGVTPGRMADDGRIGSLDTRHRGAGGRGGRRGVVRARPAPRHRQPGVGRASRWPAWSPWSCSSGGCSSRRTTDGTGRRPGDRDGWSGRASTRTARCARPPSGRVEK